MRISEILFQFLIEHQQLNLPTIGVLYLKTPITLEEDEGFSIPEDALEFVPNPNTPYDEALINAIAIGSGKIKALAIADLETFIINGKQMMNISKPFIIDRLGIIERNYKGEIHFIPAKPVHSGFNKGKHIEKHQAEIRFDDNYLLKFKKIGIQYKKIVAPISALVVLMLIFWFGYYFFRDAVSIDPQPVNVVAVTAFKDTSKATPTPPAQVNPITPDSFFIVIQKITKDKAEARLAELREWGHKVQLVTEDSAISKIRIPIHAPLSDSSQHRDSLARFFGRRVWVEQQ